MHNQGPQKFGTVKFNIGNGFPIDGDRISLLQTLRLFRTPRNFNKTTFNLNYSIYKDDYFRKFIDIASNYSTINIMETLENQFSSPDYLMYFYLYSDIWGFDLLKEEIEKHWTKYPDSFSFRWNNGMSRASEFFSDFYKYIQNQNETNQISYSSNSKPKFDQESSFEDIFTLILDLLNNDLIKSNSPSYQKRLKTILIQFYNDIIDLQNSVRPPESILDSDSNEETIGTSNIDTFSDFCSKHINFIMEQELIDEMPPQFVSSLVRQARENKMVFSNDLLCKNLIRIFKKNPENLLLYGDILSYLDLTKIYSETLLELSQIPNINALFDEVRVNQFHDYVTDITKKVIQLEKDYEELSIKYDLLNESTSNQLDNLESEISSYEKKITTVDIEKIQKEYQDTYQSSIDSINANMNKLYKKMEVVDTVQEKQEQLDEMIEESRNKVENLKKQAEQSIHKYDAAFCLMSAINSRYTNKNIELSNVLFQCIPQDSQTRDMLFHMEYKNTTNNDYTGCIYMKFLTKNNTTTDSNKALTIHPMDPHSMISSYTIEMPENINYLSKFSIEGFFSEEPAAYKTVDSIPDDSWFTIIGSKKINTSNPSEKVYYNTENNVIVCNVEPIPIVQYVRMKFDILDTQGNQSVSIQSIQMCGQICDSTNIQFLSAKKESESQ